MEIVVGLPLSLQSSRRWGMCPLCPKTICVALSMVSALNFCVLLNGIDCVRRAMILHSGGVQVSGGGIVMMVF